MILSVFSEIKTVNGAQYIFINGKPVEAIAYITYINGNARYEDFAKRGYKLFSVSLFFGSNYLNDLSRLEVFSKGIFDDDTPDYSEFDGNIEKILEVCPDALIIPRVNVSPSRYWERAHTDELCDRGTREYPDSKRPCISSDVWADEVKRMLGEFISHVESSRFKDSIAGYQIAGGNTEEWIPNDSNAFTGERAREKFALCVKNGEYSDTKEGFYRFLSDINAKRICEFASFVKEKTDRRLLVGSFYGYTMELCDRRHAHHSLATLLNCDDIDFLCSPITYSSGRKIGTDHAYMVPVHSVKLHNKLYFAENDVRTHLTRPVNDSPRYNSPLWFGPSTEKTLEIMKMHHARNLINGHGGWWFDMWGGWYDDPIYMDFVQTARELSAKCIGINMNGDSEVAVFIDENCYALLENGEGSICGGVRQSIGLMGTPYDVYLSSDFDSVKERYKAFISIVPIKTSYSDSIEKYASENKIPLCTVTSENFSMPPSYFRDFCKEAGVHIYSSEDAVVFSNESFLFLHTACEGMYEISFPELYDVCTNKKADCKFFSEKGKSYLFMKGMAFGEN